jgi:hypothetical protein
MTKSPPDDPALVAAVTVAVEACWNEGSPVAGQSKDAWRRVAQVAVRRAKSFERRGVSKMNRDAQIRDVAEALVGRFERDPGLVGPLIIDYLYVAQKALEAIQSFAAS